MSTPTSAPGPTIGIALSGPHLVALADDRRRAAALNASGLDFAVAGVDRIDGSHPDGPTLDGTSAVAKLCASVRQLGWFVAAAVHRDHPYNLARRVASLDHLAAGRIGLLLGNQDGYAPRLRDGREVWGGAGLTEGLPISPETTRDAAAAITKLWRSWPIEAIVADKSTGIYARGDQIQRTDHHGAFDIAGPLTVPTTTQGVPVLAWRVGSRDEAGSAKTGSDLVLVADEPELVNAVVSSPGTARLLLEVAVPSGGVGAVLERATTDQRIDGVVLRPEANLASLDHVIEQTSVLASRALRGSRTLRDRLGLDPAVLTSDGERRAAFAVPSTRLARA